MRVGAMNNPFAPVTDEIRAFAASGFDFVDLTLEPPGAWPVDPAEIRALLDETGLAVVGHTAFYIPIGSPFPELRATARNIFAEVFDAFVAIGVETVNVHPDPATRSYPRDLVVAANAESVGWLAEDAHARGLELMVENLGPAFGTVEQLRPLLAANERIGFHLDVGHAHLGGNRLPELLDAFGDRLRHVHVSDNLGVDDLHLPLGVGAVAWPDVVAALTKLGYDGTVTIEVFARPYLEASARFWRELWATAA